MQLDVVAGLKGVRVVIVGASAGVGRSLAQQAVTAGAEVVAAARRTEALDALIAEAGGGVAVTADVTDPEQCAQLAERCREELGEVDLLVNATGVSVLRPIAEMTADEWSHLFTTNVVGSNNLIAAMVGTLSERAIVAALSSDAARLSPRSGLGAYGASKAALEQVLAAWRNEHAPTRFSCVAIGPTMPTEVSNNFDPDLLNTLLEDWMATGTLQLETMVTDDLAFALLGVFAAALPVPGVNLEHLTVRTPSAVLGSWAATRSQSPRS